MTEQPAEPTTEQEYLGNVPRRPVAYLPNGHRIAPPKLVAPPLVSLARPFELAEGAILLRNLVNAEAAFTIANRRSIAAEQDLQRSLAEEAAARTAADEAAEAIQLFAQKAAEL